jgi:iron complex outermembrane receptor protein
LTRYKGIELIANYRVTERLRFGGGFVYLDPTIRDVSPENVDIVGNIPAEASKWQIVGNAEYYVAAIPGLSIHGNVRHFGKAPTDDWNWMFIPGYTIASAGFQYQTRIGGRKVTFTGNVNNLFNRKYWGLQNFGEGINGSLSAKIYW